MLVTTQFNIVDNYVRPIPRNKTVQFVFKGIVEIVKIIALKIFLEMIAKRYLNDSSKYPFTTVLEAFVWAPVIEEILFRRILLGGIRFIQEIPQYRGKEIFDDEKKRSQLIFRVRISSLIFGLAHLLNPHSSFLGAAVQVIWSGTGGLVYGYMTQKYESITPSILSHAINNGSVCAMMIYKELTPLFLLVIVVNRVVGTILCYTPKPSPIVSTSPLPGALLIDLPANSTDQSDNVLNMSTDLNVSI